MSSNSGVLFLKGQHGRRKYKGITKEERGGREGGVGFVRFFFVDFNTEI